MKSWRGTCFEAGLCWVALRTPSMARANFVLTYFRHAWASCSVSKEPMVRKVWVAPTPGPRTVGLFRGTPKKSVVEPDPFAAGTAILYLSKLSGPAR